MVIIAKQFVCINITGAIEPSLIELPSDQACFEIMSLNSEMKLDLFTILSSSI